MNVDPPPEGAAPDEPVAAPAWFPHGLWTAKLAVQRFVLAATGAIVTILIFIQVVTRYFFAESIFGIEEAASFLAIWLYFVGGAYGAYDRGHISASLVDLVVPERRARQVIKTFVAALTVILSVWMTVWAIRYFIATLQRGTMSLELGIEMAWVHAAMPLGLVLMTFYFALELLEDLDKLRSGAGR
jgi:TRAP-type C4-dicarboxylate transport system permease small subunit